MTMAALVSRTPPRAAGVTDGRVLAAIGTRRAVPPQP
jgi:hypothetical protein